jgi:xanthine dehydrogenase YagS FAD-binding subunit
MDRKVWTFALVSVAIHLSFENKVVRQARIVLGGVSPVPHIVPNIGTFLEGKLLDEDIINRSAEMAIAGSRPLGHNQYKVQLTKEMVKRALHLIKK